MMVDNSFDCMFHFLQASDEGSQSEEAKHEFETFARNCGVKIKNCHAENHIFNNKLFKESCMSARQTQSLCCVDSHHQKGIDERKIKTAMSLARSMLLTAMTKWHSTIHLRY